MKGLIFLLISFLPFQSALSETWQLFKETLDLSEAVEGDAFLLANDITLSGTFAEDVWGAGRKIRLTGTVADDVRLAGLEVVTVDGNILGDARIIASVGNVVITTNAVIEANAILQAGKRISHNGEVQGDLWVEAPRVVIEGTVGGDLLVKSNDVQLLPGTIVRGDLINHGSQPIPVPAGVEILGERLDKEAVSTSEISDSLRRIGWILKAIQFVTALIIGLGMLRIFPQFTGQNVDLLLNRQGPLVSIGLLSFLAMTLSGYFLLLTVIGSGVGLFLLIVTGLLFYLGKLFVAFLVGMLLLRQTTDLAFGKLALALVLGLAVLYTASTIPYIGGSIYILTSCWGMGAMLVNMRLSQKSLRIHVPAPSEPKTP